MSDVGITGESGYSCALHHGSSNPFAKIASFESITNTQSEKPVPLLPGGVNTATPVFGYEPIALYAPLVGLNQRA